MRRAARLLAAVTLTASSATVVTAAPAAAETCPTSTGVTVVVDFSGIGSGVETGCVADGGGDSAAALFGAAGHTLTRVGNFPQAVCRVDGLPESANCQNMPPANAYWGLFWSDGSGGWVYSSESVDGLNVPEGGSVAFAWQDGGETDQPGVAPPQHQSSSPSPDDGSSGGGGGTSGGGSSGGGTSGGGGGASPSGTSSTSPSTSPDAAGTPTAGEPNGRPGRDGGDADGARRDGADEGRGDRDGEKSQRDRDAAADDESASSAEPTGDVDAALTADPPTADDGGLPVWVAPAGIAGLFAAAGTIALLRRRRAA